MTGGFAEIIKRLARARDFEDGAFLLITSEPNSKTFTVEMKGWYSPIAEGYIKTLEKILSELNNEDASRVREAVIKTLL